MMYVSDQIYRSHRKYRLHTLEDSLRPNLRGSSSWVVRFNIHNKLRLSTAWTDDFIHRYEDSWRRWHPYNHYVSDVTEAKQDMKYVANMRAFMDMCSHGNV